MNYDLTQAVQWFPRTREIPRGCNVLFITLLPLKNNLTYLNDYRIISLVG